MPLLQPETSESAILTQAREAFEAAIAGIRTTLLGSPWCAESNMAREQAEYYVEQLRAVAFNLAIAPRQHYPQFLVGTLFGANNYPIWGPNPDFKYAWVWLDGAKTYRIFGNANDTQWASFQVTSEFWGDPAGVNLGDYPLHDMAIAPDGSYEIMVSATPHPGNWLPLDRDSANNYIFLRRAFVDWEHETVASAEIEMIDPPTTSHHLDTATLAARIARAGTLLANANLRYTMHTANRAIENAGRNAFFCVAGDELADEGYNPGAFYMQCVYSIDRDEALVIEVDLPKARYWGIHVTDIWLQSLDYVHHQASLNESQAVRDGDGKLRFVLALDDPGVPNWLDPAGSALGMLQLRSYYGTRAPRITTQLVKVSELRAYLPPETARITPEKRRDSSARRARSLLRHY